MYRYGDVGAEGSDTDVPSLIRASLTDGRPLPPPPPVGSESARTTSLPLLVLVVLGEAGEDMVALDFWYCLVCLVPKK